MLGPLVTVGAEAEVAVKAVYSARNRLIVLEVHIVPFDRAQQPLGEVVAQRTSVVRAQVLQRRVNRLQRKPFRYLGSLLLAVLSGYGYRLWRILAVYAVVLVIFAVLYWLLGVHSSPQVSGVHALWDTFLVSLSALHGRAAFEHLGAWSPAAWVAAGESVVGIVTEGVFVAMLIQRFFAR